MANMLRVNGRADVYIGNQNVIPGYLLGWSVDGVELAFNSYTEQVFTDNKGPNIPEDIQNFGEDARITIDLVKYDLSVLNTIIPRLHGGTVGVQPNYNLTAATTDYGTLMVQCQHFFSLGVARTTGKTCQNDGEGGWMFPYCYLMDEHSFKVGTKVTRHRLVVRAIPSDAGLYTLGFVGV